MPDLKSRKQHEDELAALLLLLFRQYQSEAVTYLGNPPRVMNLPTNFYTRIQLDVRGVLREKLAQVALESSQQLSTELEAEQVRQRAYEEAQRWAEERAGTLADDLAQRLEQAVEAEINRLLAEAGAIDVALSGEEALAVIFSAEAAERIAVTETTGAISAGEQGVAKQLRLEFPESSVKATWMIEDDSACPICTELDGTTDEVWEEIAPMGPPAHPNCRCTLEWEISDPEELLEQFCPTGDGGGVDPTCTSGDSKAELATKLPKVKGSSDLVSGLRVTKDVPNTSSIASSLDNYEVMPGIRKVSTSQFETWNDGEIGYYSADDHKRVKELAEAIKRSGKISPLIVVLDEKGPYVLEGGHRYEALKLLRVKELPAMVVVSRDSKQTLEGFCPTGEGGGQDNSCDTRDGEGSDEEIGELTDDVEVVNELPDDLEAIEEPDLELEPEPKPKKQKLKVSEDASKVMKNEIKVSWSPANVAKLLGDSTANVDIDEDRFMGPNNEPGIKVHLFNPDKYDAKRGIYRDKKSGKLVCVNLNLDVFENGTGLGTKIFSSQVEQLAKTGFGHIETNAARWSGKADAFVGYKVWPKLGYDGNIPRSATAKLPANLKAKTIQQLYSMPGGREWWEKNGTGIDLKFDLAEGSASRKVLNAYLERKRTRVKSA